MQRAPMGIRIGGLIALALALSAPGATKASPGSDLASAVDVGGAVAAVGADSFAHASVAFPDGVTAFPSVPYETLPGFRPMTLDLFLPPKRFDQKSPRPVIIYIHGGGWIGGGPRRSGAFSDWPKVLAAMAARGYVVASVSYRFAAEAPFPAAIQDVKAAIRFLRANATLYHVDGSRFVTFGQSAGGHLASLAALTCGVAALAPPELAQSKAANVEIARAHADGAETASDCVQGAVSWYGIYDFATMPKGTVANLSPVDLFLHCKEGVCDPDVVRQASPLTYVSAKTPPMLILHGEKDRQVPVAQSLAFERALKAAGVKTDRRATAHCPIVCCES